jgi:hypothetical protein
LRKLAIALLTLAASMYAADVTGTWTGPMTMTNNGETRDDTAHLVLKQTDGQVTGSIGPNEERRYNITKGTTDGSSVYIEAAVDGDNKLVLRLKLEGEKLSGDLKAEGPSAPPISGKMTLEKKPTKPGA